MVQATSFKLFSIHLLALAIAITAKPVLEEKSHIKLPLTKRPSRSFSKYNVVERDPAPLANTASGVSADLEIYEYTVPVVVGAAPNPITTFNLKLDTGSSVTWIGADPNHLHVITSTSQQQINLNEMLMVYDNHSVIANEFHDQVIIGSLVIANQTIGVAKCLSRTFVGIGIDGFLGIGPVGLTTAIVHQSGTFGSICPFDFTTMAVTSPLRDTTLPTVTDNLFNSGNISENLVSVFLQPGEDGEVIWGAIDDSKYIGSITYTPKTSSNYWSIGVSAAYGDSPLSGSTGIFVSGTFQVRLSSEAFNTYISATGAVIETSTGHYTITPDQFTKLQSLSFTISGVNFTLNPDAQIFTIKDQIYLIVNEIDSNAQSIYKESGITVDVVFGMTFIERFYSVFDTGNNRVGLAQTNFTNTIVNSVNIT